MKTVTVTRPRLPRLMRLWLLLIAAMIVPVQLLFAQNKLPMKPESRVADMGEFLPPGREESLSRKLKELFEDHNISIYVVVLKQEPEIVIPQLASHLFDEWIDAPICGLAITYPGHPEGFHLVAGGPGVPREAARFIRQAIKQSSQAGEVERVPAIKLIAVTDALSQTLVNARAEIERFERNPDYGRIDVERTSLTKLLSFFKIKVVLAVLGALVVLLISGISIRRFRSRRPLRFPEVIPRKRYGGRFSGGSNIRVSFVTRRSKH